MAQEDQDDLEALVKRSQSLKSALDQVKLLEEELDFAEQQLHATAQPNKGADPELDSIFKELEEWEADAPWKRWRKKWETEDRCKPPALRRGGPLDAAAWLAERAPIQRPIVAHRARVGATRMSTCTRLWTLFPTLRTYRRLWRRLAWRR